MSAARPREGARTAARSAKALQCAARRIGFVAALALLAAVPHAGAAERAIDKEVTVAAPVEAVWQAWTTKAGIESFFAPEAEVDARVGGAFHIHFDPYAEPGSKGADDMRLMALQPPRMLSFDWSAPPSLPEARRQRTFVVVRLAPVDGKTTRVTLHHTGWGDGGEWDRAYAYFDRAWGNVLGNLRERFANGPVDWTPWREQLRRMRAAAAASAPKPSN
jgi:uncharacterized protein YndB with AHSA1/START domain